MNTRSQQLLRISNTVQGTAEFAFELNEILGGKIGQVILGFGPDELVRIKFWSIGGKTFDMNPLASLLQKFLDDSASVDGSAIPEQNHLPSQVVQQIPQKFDHLHSRDVVVMEAKIKSQSPRGGRDSECRNGRDSVSRVAVSEDRRITSGSPGLPQVRNEQKTTFIEEGKMGLKSLGFFLSAAIRSSSSGQSLPRSFGWRDVSVSAKSIPDPPSPARRGRGDSESQSVFRSAWRFAARSKDLSNNPPPGLRIARAAAIFVSVVAEALGAGRVSAWAVERFSRPSETLGPNVPLSLSKHLGWRLPIDRFCLSAANRQQGVCGPPTVEEFLLVSCPAV